jgi:serine/threonine protein kinase
MSDIHMLFLLSRALFHTSGGKLNLIVLPSTVQLIGNICMETIFQAQNLQNGRFAAAKMCALEGEDDLSDFMIEIDILSECKHPNIVDLHEAFFNDGKLWVR